MKLIIRADADTHIGNGHIMRGLALAREWKARGGEVQFLSYIPDAGVWERIRQEGFKVYTLKTPICSRESLDLFRHENPDWVVLDGYHFTSDYQRTIKDRGYKLLVIDDFVHLQHYYADIILNQNYGAENLTYSVEPDTRLLIGPKFALLRPEFLNYRGFVKEIPEIAKKLLITLGGADSENHTLKILRAVNLVDSPLEVKVVLGASNPHYGAVAVEAGKSRHNLEIHTAVEDMAALMAWADVAISAGGTTIWELAFLGVPAILGVAAENQENAVRTMAQAGFPTLGWINDAELNENKDTLNKVLANKVLRETLSTTSQQIVDGRGTNRVIAAMREKPVRVLFLGGNIAKPLADWLQAQGAEVFYTENKIDPGVAERFNPDFIISYNYRHLLKKQVIDIAKKGAINLHISYLPWNRGAHPNVWSFLEDTPKGVTIHYLAEGIDTGDILLQEEVVFDQDQETLKTSYTKLHNAIQKLFKYHWDEIVAGKLKAYPQPQGGSLHYARDKVRFEPWITEKSWDTPMKELKQKFSRI